MKTFFSLIFLLLMATAIFPQKQTLVKPGLQTEIFPSWNFKNIDGQKDANRQLNIQKTNHKTLPAFKNTNEINIQSIGTSGNAWEFGMGKVESRLYVNPDLNTVILGHRMGGSLDPGGNVADIGYDISTDGGLTWTSQIEIYQCDTVPGGYSTHFPICSNFGIYNPLGNTNPNDAIVTTLSVIYQVQDIAYLNTTSDIGNPADTSSQKFFPDLSNPNSYAQFPYGYTITKTGDIWAADLLSTSFLSNDAVILIIHGVWNEDLQDFEFDNFELPVTLYEENGPIDVKIEFSPEGDIGYIAVLIDNGSVPVSAGYSYYPVFWRTTDGGETWEDPITVPLAGVGGIDEVKDFLSDEEIVELYGEIVPRDEIKFTTAFDFDLSVDGLGNPQIAVIIGVTGDYPYSIITTRSSSSGYMYTAAFLLSSYEMGNTGSWMAYNLGRQVSFRGSYGDLTDDNRIQVARSIDGEYMFVAWLDTDTTVSTENNMPDIWARGVSLNTQNMTGNVNGEFMPTNVTFGSEGTFASHLFSLANTVFDRLPWYGWTLPMVYTNMNAGDPGEPVTYKYITDFGFIESDFWVGIDEKGDASSNKQISISIPSPNPANGWITFDLYQINPEVVELDILSITGQLVKAIGPVKVGGGSITMTVGVSDLNPGIYFIRAKSQSGIVSRKFVVK